MGKTAGQSGRAHAGHRRLLIANNPPTSGISFWVSADGTRFWVSGTGSRFWVKG